MRSFVLAMLVILMGACAEPTGDAAEIGRYVVVPDGSDPAGHLEGTLRLFEDDSSSLVLRTAPGGGAIMAWTLATPAPLPPEGGWVPLWGRVARDGLDEPIEVTLAMAVDGADLVLAGTVPRAGLEALGTDLRVTLRLAAELSAGDP